MDKDWIFFWKIAKIKKNSSVHWLELLSAINDYTIRKEEKWEIRQTAK